MLVTTAPLASVSSICALETDWVIRHSWLAVTVRLGPKENEFMGALLLQCDLVKPQS